MNKISISFIKTLFWVIFIIMIFKLVLSLVYFITEFETTSIINNSPIIITLSKIFLILCKTFLAYQAFQIVSRLNIEKPFNNDILQRIKKMIYWAISILLMSYTIDFSEFFFHINDNPKYLSTNTESFFIPLSIILIVYFLCKKGVELQTENDLTI